MRALTFRHPVRPLSAALLMAAMFVAGCGGGTTPPASGIPAMAKHVGGPKATGKHRRVTATVALTHTAPFSRHASSARNPHETPIAEEALQEGKAYPNRESWSYSDLDPSCGTLSWSYDNSIPGVTVTLNPTETPLDGSTEVSFSQVPTGTPTVAYNQTVTGTCTGDDPTGTLPVPTAYTIAAVTLDVGRIAQVPADPTIETDKTFEPVVGQFIELKAVDGPDVKLRSQVWKTIPGTIVASYTQTTMLASPTPFDPANLKKQTLDFYWIQGSAGTALPLRVDAVFPVLAVHCNPSKCTGMEDEWGAADAESKANVVAPTNVTLTAQSGQVLVGKDKALSCNVALHFGFAEPSLCPGVKANPAPGMQWVFDATAPAGGGGDLDATQLIQRKDSRTPLAGGGSNPAPPPGTNGKLLLDECIHYGTQRNGHEPVAAGEDGSWSNSDSPDLELSPGWETLSDTDTFSMYFVYKPSDKGVSPGSSRANIWVPLGLLHWNWEGVATNSGKPNAAKWRLTSSSYSHNPSGTAGPLPLPTWTGLFHTADTECPPGG
jgi:hypothetical protein